MNLETYIRDIPGFPKAGIVFKDITILLKDAKAFHDAVQQLAAPYRNKGITKVVGIESRGFILGAALAAELSAGFVPIRKKGKLPAKTLSVSYDLEYGTDTIEIHEDALNTKDVVLLHDDLLATGGTMRAAIDLVEKLGATVKGTCFLIELSFLKGKEKIFPYAVHSLLQYTSE